MSATKRRRLIDRIVKTSLALDNAAWWDEQDCEPETAAYREWALAQVPTSLKRSRMLSGPNFAEWRLQWVDSEENGSEGAATGT
jgi:hypothetical protein